MGLFSVVASLCHRWCDSSSWVLCVGPLQSVQTPIRWPLEKYSMRSWEEESEKGGWYLDVTQEGQLILEKPKGQGCQPPHS